MSNIEEAVPVKPGIFATGEGGPWLLGNRCQTCGAAFWPARLACGRCFAPTMEPLRLGPHGTLHSFTVVRQAPRTYQGSVPYLLGIAEFPPGVRVHGQIAGDASSPPPLGVDVRLSVEPVGKQEDGRAILGWRFHWDDG